MDGDPCRACGTTLVKRTPKPKKPKPGSYHYEFYLYCPGCKRMFMIDAGKRDWEEPSVLL